MKLSQLHEAFIEKANRPMEFGSLPVTPSHPDVPVIAVDRWKQCNGRLAKTYRFRRPANRIRFVMAIMRYEDETQHHCEMIVTEDAVSVTTHTKDVNSVTELDKELACYCDVIFKDAVYSPEHDEQEF